MRSLFLSACVMLATGAAAQSQTDYSTLISEKGLSGAATTLAALPEKSASDQFALGGVQFLSAVEKALQQLYAAGIDRDMAQDSGLPFLRVPLPSNPDAQPFQPEIVAEVFLAVLPALETSRAALDSITDDDAVAVTINTSDLWFDVNTNGTRDKGESFLTLAAPQLAGGIGDIPKGPVIRFDTADAAWLSAYAHLLSGISETVLALDPTSAIKRVTQSQTAFAAFDSAGASLGLSSDDSAWVDLAAMFIHAIEGQPDVTRARAAHAHFIDMISDNQTFWSRVAAETDNKQEWIPNPAQTSALPIPFPPETGSLWRGVLAEASAVLKGDLLLPHWRLGPSAGINLARAMQDPPDIDIIAMIQGEGILPYAEKGTRMSGQSVMAFQQMLGGDALLYMIVLN